MYWGGGTGNISLHPGTNSDYQELNDESIYNHSPTGSSLNVGIIKVTQDKKRMFGVDVVLTRNDFESKTTTGEYSLRQETVAFVYDRYLLADFARGIYLHSMVGGVRVDVEPHGIPDPTLENIKYGAVIGAGVGWTTGIPFLDTFRLYYTRGYYGSAVSTDQYELSFMFFLGNPKRR